MKSNLLQMEVELLLNRLKHVNERTCVNATLLMGEKGAGKTFLTEIVAKLFCGTNWKKNYLFYQCHEGTTPAHFLYDIDVQGVVSAITGSTSDLFLQEWVKEHVRAEIELKDQIHLDYAAKKIQEYSNNSPSTLSKGVLVQACEKSLTEKVVLVIDEFDKTPRAIDAFFLDFLQNFRVNDPIFGNIQGDKNNIIIIFTSNDERLFSDPLYRRVVTIHVEYPDEKELLKRVKSNLNTSFKDDFLLLTIQFVNSIRNMELTYKPVLSEIMTLLIDLESLLKRNEEELSYFVARTLSPDLEDRNIILESKQIKEYVKLIKRQAV